MTWIQTYTGKRFDLIDPKPEQICMADIAHALSRACRFTGHTFAHYSVAEHSVLVSHMVPPSLVCEALLHDAAEAYIGDATSPLKKAMRALSDGMPSAYDEIETGIRHSIFKKFGLQDTHSPLVSEADILALIAEAAFFFPVQSCDWGLPKSSIATVPRIYGHESKKAREMFSDRAKELGIS